MGSERKRVRLSDNRRRRPTTMAIAYRNNDIGTEARSDVYGISDTNIDD